MITGYDNWKLDYGNDPDSNWCDRCDAVINTEDMFETACSCDPDAFCSECGEELPEVDDAHCTNCCDCDACIEAEENAHNEFLKTGTYPDIPVITSEKVYSNR